MTTQRRTQKHYTNPAEAFEARTEWFDNGCLIWVGSRTKSGYGVIRVDGKNVYAHRYAYAQTNGTIPAGVKIDHMCHDKACVNKEHLRGVSNKQNLENRTGLDKTNTSGYRGVYWHKGSSSWMVMIVHERKSRSGGYCPPFELHVAAYRARALRNKFFTHNDLDKATQKA